MECPCCGAEYIAGSDLCRECGSDLTSPPIEPASADAVRQTLGDPVSSIELRDAIVMGPRDTVAEAIERMRAERWGSVLVLEGDAIRGIFTEQDLLRRVGPDTPLETTRLLEVMTPDPDLYSSDAPVSAALNGMALRGNRHLPVVDDDGRLLGNVGVRMVLDHIRQAADL